MGLLSDQKLQRRDRILEAARRLIAEKGYDGMTMRDLAEASGVSVPTIYNLCGAKNELLFAAVAGEVDGAIDRLGHNGAGHRSRRGRAADAAPGSPSGSPQPRSGAGSRTGARSASLRRLIGLLGIGHEEISKRPEYYRALLIAASSSEGAREPLVAIWARLGDEFVSALREMQSRGDLEGWVDASSLAQRLRSICIWAAIEWSAGAISTQEVLSTTQYDAGLALLGVTRGQARATIEQMVKAEQGVRVHDSDALPS